MYVHCSRYSTHDVELVQRMSRGQWCSWSMIITPIENASPLKHVCNVESSMSADGSTHVPHFITYSIHSHIYTCTVHTYKYMYTVYTCFSTM